MLAVRTSVAKSRYAIDEWDARFTSGGSKRALIWCHGNHGTALNDYYGYNAQFRLFAQRYAVMAADLAGDTFGNWAGIFRVGQAISHLASLGWTDPPVLVGASMGGTVALNYARLYPGTLAAVATIIPALTLDAPPSNPAIPQINAAYPPAYDKNNPDHFFHDPLGFATEIDSKLPLGIWHSGNDPLCLPETAQAFKAARPETLLVNFGDYGHGGINVATPLVIDWFKGKGY